MLSVCLKKGFGQLSKGGEKMHTLHAILVDIKDCYKDKTLFLQHLSREPKIIKTRIRSYAMMRTDYYYERVFDYRSEDGAGSWAKEFPYPAVVLGAEEPERFRALLEKFSAKPLEMALNYYKMSQFSKQNWRTEEELKNDPALTIIDNSYNGFPNIDRKPVYWSGYPNPDLTINEETIQKIWNSNPEDRIQFSLVTDILRLVLGEYLPKSQFYSLPDGSSKLSPSVREDAFKNPEDYALVFSEYHF